MNLKKGKIVRVKYFAERPKHWNNKGLMDKYMGQEVTIRYNNRFNVGIYEDLYDNGGGWLWYESDFKEVVEVDFLEDKDFLI